MVVTTKSNHIKLTAMRVKKMLSELVDVPRMEEAKEGLLLGGFVMLSMSNGDGDIEVNRNCACNTSCNDGSGFETNTNCGCNEKCPRGFNVNCDCNSDCSHNGNCKCWGESTVPPTPKVTDPPKEPVSPMVIGFGFCF